MKNEKKSILKEALTDFNEIMDAADANAKKKLAEEFPEKFKNILKEELNKNKSAKESYKKVDEVKESDVDETEEKNESVMKKEVKETSKVGQHAKKAPFEEKPKAKTANMNEENEVVENEDDLNEEREKEFVKKKHEKDEPNFAKGTDEEKGKKFTKKVDASSGKPMANKVGVHEGYDMTGTDADTVRETIDNAGESDEFLTLDDIDRELAEMENLGQELNSMQEGDESDPFNELVKMRNQLDEMIGKLGGVQEQQRTGGGGANLHGKGGQGPFGKRRQIDEEDLTDDDIKAAIDSMGEGFDSELEEQLGVTHSVGNITTGKLPREIQHGRGRFRPDGVNESKKLNSLITENKKLMKKLNETKKYKESVTTLVENYKNALEKYRNQLKEMAVFNTNLAHVNNLFVNENLALTQEDKIKIINEFKNVNTITESQNRYKTFLSEMKTSKKTISESMEKKVGTSIQPSSKQKLDEVVEKTAYENNEHLNKMKRIIETIERSDKKKKII